MCDHFGVCGGCTCQPGAAPPAPAPYPDQLAAKEKKVRELLSSFDIEAWKPILPSPDVYHYRNKMELAFGQFGDDGLVLGLRESGRFDRIVDLETCLLMSPACLEAAKTVRTWAKAKGLKGYHRKRHQGDLRYLVLREGKNTLERMGVLIASKSVGEDLLKGLASGLQPLLTTLWVGFTDSTGDVARAQDMRLLWGSGSMMEKLGDRRFRISPYSFFQTNTRGAERLYQLLQEWVQGGGALLDLYCGSGGIALSLARCFDRVVGVDSNREAIEDARTNATLNQIKNAEFVASDALDFVAKLSASKLAIQLSHVVVDPPRPGLHPKAMQALCELNPPRVAYVSCNPETLARDLQSLAPFYRMQSVQTVDLFPHTPHVETVVIMEHR